LLPFSRTPGINRIILEYNYSRLTVVLNITLLPTLNLFNNTDKCCRSSQKCQTSILRHRTYYLSTRILTCFPFPIIQIMNSVRINLPLTDRHGQGTLALSAALILTTLCSYYHQDSHYYAIHACSRTRFCSRSTPIYHNPFGYLKYR
jgi:hypothetical protein